MTEETKGTERLSMMRDPFDENQICKLPKPTRAQTDAVKKDFKAGVRCALCGCWHHPKVVHLDYVGHAALTDRLLEVDPLWNWEPVSCDENGAPFVDKDGGMWISLTVCGVTRRGYGDSGGKTGSNATKERIGDALRNAAMRFGAALDLWHKGELHGTDAQRGGDTETSDNKAKEPAVTLDKIEYGIDWYLEKGKTVEELDKWYAAKKADIETMNETDRKKAAGTYKDTREMILEQQAESTPEMVVCPINGAQVVKDDCSECETNKTCSALGNSKESKVEMNL